MSLPPHIYVNGARRQIVSGHQDAGVYLDSDELRGRPCSYHRLDAAAWAHMERGGRVFTGGSWYGLSPEKPDIPAFSLPPLTFWQRLRRLWSA